MNILVTVYHTHCMAEHCTDASVIGVTYQQLSGCA